MNSDQIRAELQKLKLSDVAKAAGLHRNTVSNIAAGRHEMMTGTAARVAAAIKSLKASAKKKPDAQ